jgi:hypothetical protein
VDLIMPEQLVDVGRNNTMTPRQARTIVRIIESDPRLVALAGQLTQGLRNRGLIDNSQVAVAALGDRVFILTMGR